MPAQPESGMPAAPEAWAPAGVPGRPRAVDEAVELAWEAYRQGRLDAESFARQLQHAYLDHHAGVAPTWPQSEAAEWEAIQALARPSAGRRALRGFDSGFAHLNKLCDGLPIGLFLLTGAPGAGKTTFVKQIADEVARLNRVPVLFIALEQTKEELRLKTLARLARIDVRELDMYGLPDHPRAAAALETYRSFADFMYLIEGGRTTTVEHIRTLAQWVMAQTHTARCLIVVDYLQKLPGGPQTTPAQRLELLALELGWLARDLLSPVLVVSAQGRAHYGEQGLDVFGEAAQLEYSADVAAVMVNTKRLGLLRSDPRDRSVDLYIVKNRKGERGIIRFHFQPYYCLFTEESLMEYHELDQR
jgi:replicative DNA helicase